MAFCNMCGAQVADGATVCAGCSGRAAVLPATAASGLTDNVAGMLAYVTFIPAIIFLVTEPYNKSRFIRFHSFQSIFLFVAVVILHVALSFLAVVRLALHLFSCAICGGAFGNGLDYKRRLHVRLDLLEL